MSRLPIRALLLLVLVLPACGCLFHSKHVPLRTTATGAKSATLPELVDIINKVADSVQTLNLTVDIDTTVGGAKKGKVTEYQQIRGYILVRRPEMLRMIGLFPIVRNRAFDMVSDGHMFKLWIPTKNRFIIGRNDVEINNPPQPLENLRPQQIYDALLLRRIDPQTEIAVMENETGSITDAKGHKVATADYILDVVHTGEHPFLSRKIIFSRTDLLPHSQLLYDAEGNLVTRAIYEDYRENEGVNFPWNIQIVRPQEEYNIKLTVLKLDLNQSLPDDKFVLEQPPGVEVVHLDKTQTSSAAHSESH